MARTLPGSAQAPRGGRLPDFLLIGAPKAGTTALHAALARTPSCSSAASRSPSTTCAGTPRRRRTRARATRTATGSGSGSGSATWTLFAGAPRRRSCAARARRSTSTTATRAAGSPPTCREREADRGAPRPGRPGLLELDAPVGRRSRAVRRRRRGVRARGAADRRGLGAVLALPRARHVRPPARRPLRALPARAGAAAALPGAGRGPATRRSTGSAASSASPRTSSPRSRRTTPGRSCSPACAPRCSARWSARVPRPGQFLPPQVWRSVSRPLVGQLHQRGNADGRGSRPSSGPSCCDAVPRATSRCSSR